MAPPYSQYLGNSLALAVKVESRRVESYNGKIRGFMIGVTCTMATGVNHNCCFACFAFSCFARKSVQGDLQQICCREEASC